MDANLHSLLIDVSGLHNDKPALLKQTLESLLGIIEGGAVVSLEISTWDDTVKVEVNDWNYHLKDNFQALQTVIKTKIVVTMVATFDTEPAAIAYSARLGNDDTHMFNVNIEVVGPNKLNVIKAVREATGVGLRDAKDFVERDGDKLIGVTDMDVAAKVGYKLREAGAVAYW